jgi:hypothetical protein
MEKLSNVKQQSSKVHGVEVDEAAVVIIHEVLVDVMQT